MHREKRNENASSMVARCDHFLSRCAVVHLVPSSTRSWIILPCATPLQGLNLFPCPSCVQALARPYLLPPMISGSSPSHGRRAPSWRTFAPPCPSHHLHLSSRRLPLSHCHRLSRCCQRYLHSLSPWPVTVSPLLPHNLNSRRRDSFGMCPSSSQVGAHVSVFF